MKAKVNISAPSLYNFFTLQLDNALQSSQNVPQVHQPCRLPGIYRAYLPGLPLEALCHVTQKKLSSELDVVCWQ